MTTDISSSSNNDENSRRNGGRKCGGKFLQLLIGLILLCAQNMYFANKYARSVKINKVDAGNYIPIDEGDIHKIATEYIPNIDPVAYDAMFNDVGVVYREKLPASSLHCVGDNFREDSWKHRSCSFRNLCFDVKDKEFILFQSEESKLFQDALHDYRGSKYHTSASDLLLNETSPKSVSIGAINLKWGSKQDRMKWFPKVKMIEDDEKKSTGYYELPENMVLMPYHSLNAMNPGHLVWDDFLPIYSLLSLFQFVDDFKPFPLRYIDNPPLWATCDTYYWRKENCAKMMPKFFPLMGINASKTIDESYLNTTIHVSEENLRSNLVCAKHGAAGMGALSDHGTLKIHGWEESDYEINHNAGRGALLYSFRNYMMKNIGLQPGKYVLKKPFKVVFSTKSSSSRGRSFDPEINAVREAFTEDEVEVVVQQMSELSLNDQVKLVSEAALYITVNGGGAVTGIFLPKGSSLIMFYQPNAGRSKAKRKSRPAFLDWDMLNNLSYLRTHWVSLDSKETSAFVSLVRHELSLLSELHE